MKVHNKLIRDDYLEKFDAKGITYEYEIVSPERKKELLLKKIVEEAKEVQNATSRESRIEELGDIQQIQMEIMKMEGISASEVEFARLKKLTEKGGFEKGIFLKTTSE